MANGGSPKDNNYVQGFPKSSQLSPVLRTGHIHYNNESSSKFCKKKNNSISFAWLLKINNIY